jgi:hypothetical protein
VFSFDLAAPQLHAGRIEIVTLHGTLLCSPLSRLLKCVR